MIRSSIGVALAEKNFSSNNYRFVSRSWPL
jgi:hypothetical protein